MPRVQSLTTEDLRSMFERAFNQSQSEAVTLIEKLQALEADAASQADDNLQNSSSNSHSSGAHVPGANRPSDGEMQRGWRNLIDRFRKSQKFLRDASKYGLDAFTVIGNQAWPEFPAALDAALRVITDEDENWSDLCDEYDIPAPEVVGQIVGDKAVYMWVMNGLYAVHEYRNDFSMAIAG